MSIASASGSRISLAKCSAAMATTTAASVNSGEEELRARAIRYLTGTASPHFEPVLDSANAVDAQGVHLRLLL
jgi:hypothetical protein